MMWPLPPCQPCSEPTGSREGARRMQRDKVDGHVRFAPNSGHSAVLSAGRILQRQRTQLERRQTGHHVQCNRALKRYRLKRDGAVGTAKENVRACTQTNANISRNTDILASERSKGQSSGRCEHGPAQHATGADAYVQTHGVEGTRVGFAFLRCVGSEEAPHRLGTDYDEADTW